MTDVVERWAGIAKTDPIIFLEQAWIDLQGHDSRGVREAYLSAASADPCNAARLIEHFASRPWASDVLIAAFTAFPRAADTYPKWKTILPAQEVAAIQEAVRSAHLPAGDDGTNACKNWATKHVPRTNGTSTRHL